MVTKTSPKSFLLFQSILIFTNLFRAHRRQPDRSATCAHSPSSSFLSCLDNWNSLVPGCTVSRQDPLLKDKETIKETDVQEPLPFSNLESKYKENDEVQTQIETKGRVVETFIRIMNILVIKTCLRRIRPVITGTRTCYDKSLLAVTRVCDGDMTRVINCCQPDPHAVSLGRHEIMTCRDMMTLHNTNVLTDYTKTRVTLRSTNPIASGKTSPTLADASGNSKDSDTSDDPLNLRWSQWAGHPLLKFYPCHLSPSLIIQVSSRLLIDPTDGGSVWKWKWILLVCIKFNVSSWAPVSINVIIISWRLKFLSLSVALKVTFP